MLEAQAQGNVPAHGNAADSTCFALCDRAVVGVDPGDDVLDVEVVPVADGCGVCRKGAAQAVVCP
jgi:hypothetical protein